MRRGQARPQLRSAGWSGESAPHCGTRCDGSDRISRGFRGVGLLKGIQQLRVRRAGEIRRNAKAGSGRDVEQADAGNSPVRGLMLRVGSRDVLKCEAVSCRCGNVSFCGRRLADVDGKRVMLSYIQGPFI